MNDEVKHTIYTAQIILVFILICLVFLSIAVSGGPPGTKISKCQIAVGVLVLTVATIAIALRCIAHFG